MSEKSGQDHNKSKGQPKQRDRATVAARDPKPGAVNRPGFDLGGATGESKLDDKNHIQSATMRVHDAVNDKPRKAAGANRVTAKMQSAVAGIRNWLRRE